MTGTARRNWPRTLHRLALDCRWPPPEQSPSIQRRVSSRDKSSIDTSLLRSQLRAVPLQGAIHEDRRPGRSSSSERHDTPTLRLLPTLPLLRTVPRALLRAAWFRSLRNSIVAPLNAPSVQLIRLRVTRQGGSSSHRVASATSRYSVHPLKSKGVLP